MNMIAVVIMIIENVWISLMVVVTMVVVNTKVVWFTVMVGSAVLTPAKMVANISSDFY